MSSEPRRLTTEEHRERLYAARYRGGLCALCGRTLDEGEPVYWERFAIGKDGGVISRPQAPVASECASQWLVDEKRDEAPEPCAGCDRPVFYAQPSPARRRAVCSTSCYMRVHRAVPPQHVEVNR
jgi:hypothetical protein